jgi:hypothetical protein
MFSNQDDYKGFIYEPDEQTKETNPKPAESSFVPGVYRICYLCGIEAATLPKNCVFTLIYTKEQSREEIWSDQKPEKYANTFCVDCYRQFIENK